MQTSMEWKQVFSYIRKGWRVSEVVSIEKETIKRKTGFIYSIQFRLGCQS